MTSDRLSPEIIVYNDPAKRKKVIEFMTVKRPCHPCTWLLVS